MDYEIETSTNALTLHLKGQLLSTDRDQFNGLIPKILSSPEQMIVINMGELTYMDSVGLGLLITIRDEAMDQNKTCAIHSPKGDVAELLAMASFERLFEIVTDAKGV